MSAIAITVAALKGSQAITDIVADRIEPIFAPPFTSTDIPRQPDLIINLIHESDEALLSGAAHYAEARISIECRASRGSQVNKLGEAVKACLTAIVQAQVAGHEATFFKEGTDVTGYRDDVGVAQRTLDFYLRWR